MAVPNVPKQGGKMEKYSYESAVNNAKTHPIISQYTDLCALKKIIGNRVAKIGIINTKSLGESILYQHIMLTYTDINKNIMCKIIVNT